MSPSAARLSTPALGDEATAIKRSMDGKSATCWSLRNVRQQVKAALTPRNHCDICDQIWGGISQKVSSNGGGRVELGVTDKILKSSCDRHKSLMDILYEELKLRGRNGILSLHKDYWSKRLFFWYKDDTDDGYAGTSSTNFDFLGNHGLGIRLTSLWIDEGLIHRWFGECINRHGKKCSSPVYLRQMTAAEPRYLIDLQGNCLVPAPTNADYAALSYVWGQIDMMKTTSSNLNDLQRLGAFADPTVQQRMPKTVRHAMYLASRLAGVRYIWIDALCIVQDDEVMMRVHIPQMSSIYAHATVVIIDINGTTADHGLRGIRGAPDPFPRDLNQIVIPFDGQAFVRQHKIGDDSDRTGRYYTRGWTFQESFFARRSIVFENDSIWFQCCSNVHVEDHALPLLPRGEREWMLNVGYPSITVLSRIIQDFNQRDLTYQQDCLSAFAGTMNCFERMFPGGFVCGLPSMFIDAMLLWQPGGNLMRRMADQKDDRTLAEAVNRCLPSWSWVGWQGLLDFDGWSTANSFLSSCSGWTAQDRCHIMSTTTWYAATDSEGRNRQQIECQWIQWRERFRASDALLPNDWTKRKKKKRDTFTFPEFPQGYGRYIYRYRGKRNPEFWYPIPLDSQPGIPKIDPDAAYLIGEVEIADVYILGQVCTTKSVPFGNSNDRVYVQIGTVEDISIGRLILHSDDYLEKHAHDLTQGKIRIQVIAISEGSIPYGIDYGTGFVDEYEEVNKSASSEGHESYEFYNVLWISWHGNVAKREALGRVTKSAWRESEVKKIEICLN